MGGVFRQPVLVSRDLPELIRSMREKGIDTLAAALDRSAMTSDEARLDRDGVAVVIGNEGSGLSTEMIEACGKTCLSPPRPGPRASMPRWLPAFSCGKCAAGDNRTISLEVWEGILWNRLFIGCGSPGCSGGNPAFP